MMRVMIPVLITILSAVAAAPAHAHWADQAVAEVVVDGSYAHLTLTFPTGLAAFADDNRDGQIAPHEARAHRAELETFFSNRISLTDGGVRGQLTVEPSTAAPLPAGLTAVSGTHSTLRLLYRWPRPLAKLSIRYDLFLPGVSTASCLATIVQGGRVRTVVFTPEHRQWSGAFGDSLTASQLLSFTMLGVRHILTGYDHMLFLLALLMLGGGLRSLLKIVTAFTVAHSVTLSLAVLDIVTLPARLVESGIALSIAFVGAENLWRRDQALPSRWLITFGFGLLHGLGFASILKEMAIARPALALSLVGFNLGVEVGQITIVAGAWLGLQMLRRLPGESAARRWASAAAAVTGTIWFIRRALLSG